MIIGDWLGDALTYLGEIAERHKLVSYHWIEEGKAFAIYRQPRNFFPFKVEFYDYVDGSWQYAGTSNAEYNSQKEIGLSQTFESPATYIKQQAEEYYQKYPDAPNPEYPISRTNEPPKFSRYSWS